MGNINRKREKIIIKERVQKWEGVINGGGRRQNTWRLKGRQLADASSRHHRFALFCSWIGVTSPLSLSLSLSPPTLLLFFPFLFSHITCLPHLLFLHKYAFNEDDHGLVLQWPTRPRARCLGLHSFHTPCVGFAPTISWLLAR